MSADLLRRAADEIDAAAEKATKAPWLLRFTDRFGWPVDTDALAMSEDDIDEDFDGDLSVVGETALPRPNGRDPGNYEPQHIICTGEDADLYPGMAQFAEMNANYSLIAMLGTAAAPIAAWLRAAASSAEAIGAELGAVAVARAILGEDQ